MILGKFNKEKIIKLRLLKAPIIILSFLLSKFLLNKKIYIENVPFIYINYNYIADAVGFTKQQTELNINRLCKDKYIYKKLEKKNGNKLYISLNYNFIDYILEDNQRNKNFLTKLKKLYKGDSMLLDLNQNKKYSTKSEVLLKKIIENNKDLFSMRLNPNNPTKKYISSCKILQDLYSGSFLNSRLYFFDSPEKFSNDWKDIIKGIEGDWTKIEELLNYCISNFRKMFEKNRMPMNKDLLQKSFDKWLYDDYSTGINQSQFIQCFNEPTFVYHHLSEIKADNIFSKLSDYQKIIGNKLFSLNKSMASGKFWELFSKMLEWCKFLSVYDENKKIYQIVEKSEMILDKFFEFLMQNKISVNLSTFDIEKSVECNMPCVWFLQELNKKYNIDLDYLKCITENDFINYSTKLDYIPF
jgi:hypothetical protein